MTSVTFMWKDAKDAPEDIYEPVIYVTLNGRIGTFRDTVGFTAGNEKNKDKHYSNWNWLMEKYNVEFWAYQKEIKPNRNIRIHAEWD